MLVAAAFCPHPPMLVPAVASGAAPELEDLRKACDEVVSRLVRSGPAMILLLGSGRLTRAYDSGAHGTLDGFGLDSGLDGDPELPLSLTIGRWLLDRAQWGGSVLAHSITPGLPPAVAADLGWRLTAGAKRIAILAMGEGTICRTEKAPGHFDPAAEAFDNKLRIALALGHPGALGEIDPDEAERLGVTARAPLQALAGAAAGGRWLGDVMYTDAPYGVGYLVAHWDREKSARVAEGTESLEEKDEDSARGLP